MAYFANHVWPKQGGRWEPAGPIVDNRWPGTAWPSNVWAGTSLEQEWDGRKRLTARLDLLAQVPAPVRFVSCEPLLGPLDLRTWLPGWADGTTHESPRGVERYDLDGAPVNPISWVICGGESGPKARPMHPDWARSLRDQCQAAEVPYFFKQWGAWAWAPDYLNYSDAEKWGQEIFGTVESQMHGSGHTCFNVGKKAAGALLDGRQWRDFPRVGPTLGSEEARQPDG